ncbi:Hypothetical leucine rich repeat protein [Ectocarpus siliculosus]|uniref:Hypothetical leucine rich repeat protein n=1 Tax=Ectocarpus siliculosus TaxID=2880 RepID=D7G433_ECTSI|nr:Hypothetical leucine rich repeat protein [Ectocarpus siliculosus]|eukprot:CBJ27068.1 Hypothetical leucine rich repeat protein [Ectocarpus siliculosus]
MRPNQQHLRIYSGSERLDLRWNKLDAKMTQ